MTTLFLKIVNMSITASWFVLAIILLRLILRKAPKWVNVLLWGMVGIRLICPFSPESTLSLVPSVQTINPEIINYETIQHISNSGILTNVYVYDHTPEINSGIEILDEAINPILLQYFAPTPEYSADPLQIWIPIWSMIWILGMVLMALYTLISYWRLHRKVSTAILLQDNIFQSEQILSPFVLGIVKPRIYLPFSMSDTDISHVIAHEQAHIRRKDHWWKPLGFLLLTVHWFNPILWISYILLCRDIEMACDEKVIREMNQEQRADYSQALLSCSINRKMIAACPLAFGEVGVKERIKSVLHYKKPAFWIVFISIVISAIAAVCFLTNPTENGNRDDNATNENINSFYQGKVLCIESRDHKNPLILSTPYVGDPIWEYFEIEIAENLTLPGEYNIHFSIDSITEDYIEISFDTELYQTDCSSSKIYLTEGEKIRLFTSLTDNGMYYAFSIEDAVSISEDTNAIEQTATTPPEYDKISELLAIICSSSSNVSSLDDCIKTHQAEYNMLLNDYTEYTLRYCFEQFLQGDQTDLRGHIMASACDEIIQSIEGSFYPEKASSFSNGQTWFEQFRQYAERLKKYNSYKDLAEKFPAAWILIQLMEEMSVWELLQEPIE